MARTTAELIVESAYTGSSPSIVAGTAAAAITNVGATVDATGSDSVDQTIVENTFAGHAAAINDILAALRSFNIIET